MKLGDPELCLNLQCECHEDPEKAVMTPFPVELGNPYCCSKCAKSRIAHKVFGRMFGGGDMSVSGGGFMGIQEDPEEIRKQRSDLLAENIKLKCRINILEVMFDLLDDSEDIGMSEEIPASFWKLFETYKVLKERD